ncbi:hypothetical protein L1280_001226 [Deinococcus sp. HSC-46F16]|uniref:hypothetical protein n=1 Tax=Deinococcus sp. HSC-46F16 TaxID=2910968 RepID=UPI0020A092B0|nr:hypothetical protein [Deinococcus sp. HSC-46F16]MCP2014089.1 hypothetical protein [Deinococcus sp. HSC-46F16]
MSLLLLALLLLGLAVLVRLSALGREVRGLRARLEALEAQVRARVPVPPPAPAVTTDPEPVPPPAAAPPPVWPEDPGAGEALYPARTTPIPSRTVFAVLGAGVTLVGAAWFLAALARSGVLTREVLLGLAAALAVALYAAAGRAAPVIGEAMRGLGYGLLALCLGALVGAGVASAGTVLAAILALSLAVAVHGAARGRLLGTATALAGAGVATWLLADNLGEPTFAGLAGLGIAGATALAERRLRPAGSGVLALLPAVGLLGLVVTTQLHGQAGHPLLWGGLLLGAVCAALAVALRTEEVRAEEEGPASSVPTWLPARVTLGAAGVLLAGLAGAAPLLSALNGGAGAARPPVVAALLGLGAICGGLALGLHRRGPGAAALRDAVLGVGVGTLGGALAFGLDGWRTSTRLLGLASGVALLGAGLRSPVWRGVGATGLGLVLADHLVNPWPSSPVVAALALGGGLVLGGRAGAVVAGLASVTLMHGLSVPGGLLGNLGAGTRFLAAAGTVALLSAGTLALHHSARSRSGWGRLAGTLVWGAVAGGSVLILLGAASAGSGAVFAGHSLLAGGLLYALARLHRPLLPVRVRQGLEGVAVGAAALGLLTGPELDGAGERAAPLLALLAVGVAALPGETRRFWRAWPVLGVALLASAGAMLEGPAATRVEGWRLLGAAGTGAALALLGTPGGWRWLVRGPDPRGDRARVGRLLSPPPVRDVVLPALTLGLLALAGRTAEYLLGGQGSLTLASTAALLAGAVALLVQARGLRRPLRWWVGLAAFGVGALKLVLLDVSDLGGLLRGAATVVIGLLLLGIGQLAPRPDEEAVPDGAD